MEPRLFKVSSPAVEWKTEIPPLNISIISNGEFVFDGYRGKFQISSHLEESKQVEILYLCVVPPSKSVESLGASVSIKNNNNELKRIYCNKILCNGHFQQFASISVDDLILEYGGTTSHIVLVCVFDMNSKDIIPERGTTSSVQTQTEKPTIHSLHLQRFLEDCDKLLEEAKYPNAVLKCGDRSFYLKSSRSEDSEVKGNHGTVFIDAPSPEIEKILLRLFDNNKDPFCLFGLCLSERPSIRTSCLQNLSENMEKLFDNPDYSDVVVECRDLTFSLNKNILSMRSEVFARMFQSKMSEEESGKVKPKDIEPTVVEQFLRYVYSGRVNSFSVDSVFNLYKAAHMYEVKSLTRKCASFMVANISEALVCDVLQHAHNFEDTELFDIAASFVVQRAEFLKTLKWLSFAKLQPEVAVKVYMRIHAQ